MRIEIINAPKFSTIPCTQEILNNYKLLGLRVEKEHLKMEERRECVILLKGLSGVEEIEDAIGRRDHL